MTVRSGHIDWRTIRDTIDLADVTTRLLGEAPGRRGERSGRKSWWICPFHADINPSLCVRIGSKWWRCYGCGAHGNAAELVMRLNGITFPEAIAYLAGDPTPSGPALTSHEKPTTLSPADDSTPPSGMTPEAAEALVAEAEQHLWNPAGFGPAALTHLHRRGLSDATIRKARLGYVESLDLPGRPRGIVVPWFNGDHLALVKIRQPEGRTPKYREVFRNRPMIYPGRHVVRAGRPLVIVEGEFDALLLGQKLADLTAVVTLGSASAWPDVGVLGGMLNAAPWYLAHDNDAAGDKAAAEWPARARRVRPPCKDWAECFQAGIDLRLWWQEALVREAFLSRLQARGVRLDGRMVHPRIAVGTVTGRIVYTDPALQVLPEPDRLARLAPVVEGRLFVRADYGQIEPRIMLAILRRRDRITWDAGDDLYHDLTTVATNDRDSVKVAINKLINGGRPDPGATGRLAEFTAAVEDYRAELAADARTRGHVATLAGRVIPLSVEESNFEGKALNRLVQGTAADIFNRAVAGIDQALGRLGSVAFLLYDELWVECDPADSATVAAMIRAEMITAALGVGVYVPVRIDHDPGGEVRFSWDQLSRWRWGPAAEVPAPGIVVDRPAAARMMTVLQAAADDPSASTEPLEIQDEPGE